METALTGGPAPLTAAGQSRAIEDFDAVVETYRPRVFRFVLASLRDPGLAENLTQDCFVRAYQARGKYRGDASVSTWLMQIAANLVRNQTNSGRWKFWKKALAPQVEMADASRLLMDPQISPEAQVLAKERVSAIWALTEKLPERQRTVFLLRFVEDMDLLEIAAVTGMKEGTVKTHLFRATNALRNGLQGQGGRP